MCSCVLERCSYVLERCFCVLERCSCVLERFYTIVTHSRILRVSSIVLIILGNDLWGTYKTSHKKSVSPETENLMMNWPGIKLEYEFYYYVRQRFYRQLYAVKRMELLERSIANPLVIN